MNGQVMTEYHAVMIVKDLFKIDDDHTALKILYNKVDFFFGLSEKQLINELLKKDPDQESLF